METTTKMEKIICPCCGHPHSVNEAACVNCQARSIGAPMVQPANKLPSLGTSFAALAVALLIIAGFVGTWLLTSDMKVIRVFMVAVFGAGTEFTKALLAGDPSLLQYRIFTFDAYRLACVMSFGAIPLSIIGMWLARRARRLSRHQPLAFGGQRIALTAMTLSLLLFVAFSAAGISSIPRAIQSSRARHLAATRAEFYHLHSQALTKYYQEMGTYPQELADLRDFVTVTVPQADYWGNNFSYLPTALIASKKSTPGYSNYRLVSAGPDGIPGTWDDIQMIDGVILSETNEPDPLSGFFTSEK